MENEKKKFSVDNLPIQVFADGPTLDEIENFDHNIVRGYTFNPTLFRRLNVSDYIGHCQKLITTCGNMPVSLEVIADAQDEMVRQARKLSELDENVFVKIPISYTNGRSSLPVIKTLVNDGIKLNITAVFTLEQVKYILPDLCESEAIISIFSGRLFDIGVNAIKITGEIAKLIHEQSNCKILWASPRMVYDLINACTAHCDIITMQSDLIKKLPLFEKNPEEYSLDTVKMFYRDAVESGFIL